MARHIETPTAQVILEAVQHATNADIPALRQLTASRPNILKLDLVLRILLTYLPEGTEPGLYVDFLQEISQTASRPVETLLPNLSASSEQDQSEDEERFRVRRLHLTPLVDAHTQSYHDEDLLTLFLLHQAHRIDTGTGSLQLVAQLLEPFPNHSEVLRTWIISYLLPLLRLDYEYYPHSGPPHSLSDFEKFDDRNAVSELLSKAARREDPGDTQRIGRDLRGLVGPRMYGNDMRKRRKLSHPSSREGSNTSSHVEEINGPTTNEQNASGWSCVNEWILELSLRDFQRSVDAIVQWNGPNDVDYGDWALSERAADGQYLQDITCRYAQAGLAAIYATNESSLETVIGSHHVLLKVAKLIDLDEPPDLQRTDIPGVSGIDRGYINSLSPAYLLHNALLLRENPLTYPSQLSICFYSLILSSCYKLLHLGNVKTFKNVLHLCLFATEADQVADLRKTLHNLKTEKIDGKVWASIRRQILWLHNWEHSANEPEQFLGIYNKVAKQDLEGELLRAMLDGGCYSFAAEIYCKQEDQPLPMSTVEGIVLTSAMSFYDGASNGNRTRGGVHKASGVVSTFSTYFPKSDSFARISALLSATHAMSFYSLTLQHGIPLQPVNIRAHKDPMSLIGKLLSQNPRSYTHLDDMLDIGQNLVAAGLTRQSQGTIDRTLQTDPGQEIVVGRRRITRMAIQAALEEEDFDTAYSYVINRLSQDRNGSPAVSDDLDQIAKAHDDISWRAAYEAGRYPSSPSNSSTLRRLEQRLELLSQALLLAPPSALSEVLHAWQRCEGQFIAQTARETEEEQKWEKKVDGKMPGEFTADTSPVVKKARDPTRGALVEEAPMGLFDVARGAAAALGKSAFPLRTAQKEPLTGSTQISHERPLSMASASSSDEGDISGTRAQSRVRKRDMVSSMVTGGLASGIGWVIGAPPVRSD